IAAGGASLGFVTAQGIRGHRDNRNRPQIDSSGCLVAIDSRQLNIHQDEIRLFALRQPNSILSVEGLDQIVTRPAQDIAHYCTVVLLVLDDENAFSQVGHAKISVIRIHYMKLRCCIAHVTRSRGLFGVTKSNPPHPHRRAGMMQRYGSSRWERKRTSNTEKQLLRGCHPPPK